MRKAQGKKNDQLKPRTDLLSPLALLATAEALRHGATKYPAHNWRQGLEWSRVIGALLRHSFAFMMGEDIDQDSGLPHIDCAACCAMFLQEYYRTHKHLDDRYKIKK